MQVNSKPPGTPYTRRTGFRSGCPINTALESLGDRWALLIVRDLMLYGHGTFADFLDGAEGIASNILADRLKRLHEDGIIAKQRHRLDGRRFRYSLTAHGFDLRPVLIELARWTARWHPTDASEALLATLRSGRARRR